MPGQAAAVFIKRSRRRGGEGISPTGEPLACLPIRSGASAPRDSRLMLGVLTSTTQGGPCERTLRGTADRRFRSAPTPVCAGADDRGWRTVGDGRDLE